MKCPKCHYDNPSDSKFCKECGTQLLAVEEISVSYTKTLVTPIAELATGSTFAGRYQIIEELGRGGMGVVYKAEDTKLKRTVALKFLPPELTHISEVKERFKREAQAAAALDHPNICTVYEFDEAEEKTFISMAYIEGQSLKKKIESGPLELDEALRIATQVAEGLEEAHKKEIIHRDIKSANIMVTEKGQAKIMDFGLARVAGGTLVTKEGMTMGTIAYMSPEQARGEDVDHRTDIWSLGVVLYEMFSGQLPFKGEHDQVVLHSILNQDPKPLADLRTGIPSALEEIVGKALAKDPKERYQSIGETLIDMRSIKKEIETGISEAKLSFFKHLLKRRVPQIVGLYLVTVWAIVQIAMWLVNRFILSPHLPNFILVILLFMIPSVLILAYFHGRRDRGKWLKVEKIIIPVNLLISAVLLFFMFSGKDLGATTKTITVKNEEGQIIERVIPKSEFRKNIAIFFFDNETSDSTLNWLQYAFPRMLSYDLFQDLYLNMYMEFGPKLKRAGYQEGTGAPLTIKKKFAEDRHLNYFVIGSFLMQNDVVTVRTILYKTKNAKRIAENSFSGTDIFELVDSMSVQLKHDLKIPKSHIEETEDLPVSERLTKSMSAFKNFAIAEYEIWQNNDHKAAAQHLENAIKEDPTFAYANFFLHEVYLGLSVLNWSKSMKALRAAMKHRYKLPERFQFRLKHYFLARKLAMNALRKGEGGENVGQELLENAKSWVQIYPEELEGHLILANIYITRNQLDEAISEYKRTFELDSENYDYLHTIGFIYGQKGEFEDALKYYNQYANLFLNDYRSFTALGGLYRTMGDFEQAETYYKKALLIEPEKISILTALANIKIVFGNFEQALEQYQDMLKIADTPQDRSSVYSWLSSYYRFRGQIRKAREYFDLCLAEMRKFLSPSQFSSAKSGSMGIYGSAESFLRAFIDMQSGSPYYKIISFGYFMVYRVLWNENPDKADQAQRRLDGIESLAQEKYRYLLFMAQGGIHQLKKEFSQAIENFQKAYELSPPDYKPVIYIALGECYRELGEFENAEKSLQKTIKIFPFEPLSNYEIALVYWDMGKKENAQEHLKKALYVWEEADPDYKPAKKAREKLAEWESSNSKLSNR